MGIRKHMLLYVCKCLLGWINNDIFLKITFILRKLTQNPCPIATFRSPTANFIRHWSHDIADEHVTKMRSKVTIFWSRVQQHHVTTCLMKFFANVAIGHRFCIRLCNMNVIIICCYSTKCYIYAEWLVKAVTYAVKVVISWKQCNIVMLLQRNRIHVSYQIALLLMLLSELWGHSSVTVVLKCNFCTVVQHLSTADEVWSVCNSSFFIKDWFSETQCGTVSAC